MHSRGTSGEVLAFAVYELVMNGNTSGRGSEPSPQPRPELTATRPPGSSGFASLRVFGELRGVRLRERSQRLPVSSWTQAAVGDPPPSNEAPAAPRSCRWSVYVSAARHAHELEPGAFADKDPGEPNPLAIVNVMLAVAAATIWLVALPAARDEPASHSSCEAIVLVNDQVTCGTRSDAHRPGQTSGRTRAATDLSASTPSRYVRPA